MVLIRTQSVVLEAPVTDNACIQSDIREAKLLYGPNLPSNRWRKSVSCMLRDR